MQALRDIFAIWDPTGAPEPDLPAAARVLAAAIEQKEDTVYRWLLRKRIPDTAWQPIIEAAGVRGKTLTISDLHRANRPAKARGRASHKVRASKRRRAEALVAP